MFRAAAAGFGAAVHEPRATGRRTPGATVIHTGFWGCGAFGGNRDLMCLLQVLAAEAATPVQLLFYAADDAGTETAKRAIEVYRSLPATATIPELLDRITDMGYIWGVSNGT